MVSPSLWQGDSDIGQTYNRFNVQSSCWIWIKCWLTRHNTRVQYSDRPVQEDELCRIALTLCYHWTSVPSHTSSHLSQPLRLWPPNSITLLQDYKIWGYLQDRVLVRWAYVTLISIWLRCGQTLSRSLLLKPLMGAGSDFRPCEGTSLRIFVFHLNFANITAVTWTHKLVRQRPLRYYVILLVEEHIFMVLKLNVIEILVSKILQLRECLGFFSETRCSLTWPARHGMARPFTCRETAL